MSCYFRQMKDVLAEAGVEVTDENKKQVDRIIHEIVSVEYKACSPTWKAVKEQIKGDAAARARFISQLERRLARET